MKNLKYFNLKVKNYYRLVLSCVFCLLMMSLTVSASRNISADANRINIEPRATFDRIWVDYDVTETGQKGMRIHLRFTVYDLKNANCLVGIYFKDQYNVPLKDYNKRFYTTQGKVAVTRQLTPGYNPTYFEDLQLFMPYEELDLVDGNYNLKMDVILLYNDGEVISNLTTYPFTYNKGNKNVPPRTTSTTAPSGKLDRIWVDYDITEKGRLGMRVHAKFSAYNMKGVDSYLAVYFQKKDGTPLKTNEPAYASPNGDIVIRYGMKPGYNPADYSDAQMFIPYEELNLNRGKHNLRMDVDLIYENGNLIEHLGFHDFWYDTGK